MWLRFWRPWQLRRSRGCLRRSLSCAAPTCHRQTTSWYVQQSCSLRQTEPRFPSIASSHGVSITSITRLAPPQEASGLHHEGRALDVGLLARGQAAVPNDGLAILGSLASDVGFNYVSPLEDGQTVHMSATDDSCRRAIDLAFLVDASGSISQGDYEKALGANVASSLSLSLLRLPQVSLSSNFHGSTGATLASHLTWASPCCSPCFHPLPRAGH